MASEFLIFLIKDGTPLYKLNLLPLCFRNENFPQLGLPPVYYCKRRHRVAVYVDSEEARMELLYFFFSRSMIRSLNVRVRCRFCVVRPRLPFLLQAPCERSIFSSVWHLRASCFPIWWWSFLRLSLWINLSSLQDTIRLLGNDSVSIWLNK